VQFVAVQNISILKWESVATPGRFNPTPVPFVELYSQVPSGKKIRKKWLPAIAPANANEPMACPVCFRWERPGEAGSDSDYSRKDQHIEDAKLKQPRIKVFATVPSGCL